MKNLREELENMILTFKVRTVIQEAQRVKDISEIDSGTLTKESINRLLSLFKQQMKELVKKLNKLKWKNTRKTMLISVKNGELGFHTGSGFDHNPLTIGTLEELQHCHHNDGIEDAKVYLEKLLKNIEGL